MVQYLKPPLGIGLHPTVEARWVKLVILGIVALSVGVIGVNCHSGNGLAAVRCEDLA